MLRILKPILSHNGWEVNRKRKLRKECTFCRKYIDSGKYYIFMGKIFEILKYRNKKNKDTYITLHFCRKECADLWIKNYLS